MTRQARKIDHLRHCLELKDGPQTSGFEDIRLVHNCLPEIDAQEIQLHTRCVGMQLNHPLIINAMTGGAVALTEVNARLAEVAARTQSVMAVGSQFAALETPAVRDSFAIVRRKNPKGMVWANIGAYAGEEDARRVVEMVEANALQIHLNAGQEVAMPEGDSKFSGWLRQIERMVRALPVPVVVKETGCGMAGEQIRQLASLGVAAIDVGGAGGTNFIAIEAARSEKRLPSELLDWGIPTAVSAFEAVEVLPPSVDLIVSGGIRTALDIIKAMAIGASAVGLAAPLVQLTEKSGVEAAVDWVEESLLMLRKYLFLMGKANFAVARNHPLIVGGETRNWLELRQISPARYACRGRS